MSKRLSEIEIKKRLTRLTNLERLYANQTITVRKLRAENKQLKLQIADMAARFELIVETQVARITELETMIFGRKKRPRSGNGNDQSVPKQPRSASSFRRDPYHQWENATVSLFSTALVVMVILLAFTNDS